MKLATLNHMPRSCSEKDFSDPYRGVEPRLTVVTGLKRVPNSVRQTVTRTPNNVRHSLNRARLYFLVLKGGPIFGCHADYF
jgi:hypothetical protein